MLDRRRFLQILAAAATMMSAGKGVVVGQQPAAGTVSPALGTLDKAYTFFTEPEVRFITAAVSRLIPADDLGPGALEADVPYFLDQQLAGRYGQGGRAYISGPWGAESPFQGYQLSLTPAELYRVGIQATNRYSQETYQKDFADLEPIQQDELLQGLQEMSVDLEDVPGATFFTVLLSDTKNGFFSDPSLGGNRDKVGWRLIGYPGVAAVYTDHIFTDNEPYHVEPVSISDVRTNTAALGEHGHAVHRMARQEDIVKTSPVKVAAARVVTQSMPEARIIV
jgi:gluconate 2-dehydrogenase gamma chain